MNAKMIKNGCKYIVARRILPSWIFWRKDDNKFALSSFLNTEMMHVVEILSKAKANFSEIVKAIAKSTTELRKWRGNHLSSHRVL